MIEMAEMLAKQEASRCLFCFDAPCQADCPAGIDVPQFLRRMAQENLRGAYDLIRSENPIPWICGILCPTEMLCARHCCCGVLDRAIRIGELQAYATRHEHSRSKFFPAGKRSGNRVAVIGTGPAGLAAISSLSQAAFDVTAFEAEDYPGGLITYGMPPYKINKQKALSEIKGILRSPGVSVHLKTAARARLSSWRSMPLSSSQAGQARRGWTRPSPGI